MKTVSIDLPESVFYALRKEPDEFVQEMRIAAAVKWYEMGQISQNQAAEIAGVNRLEFIDVLSRYRVSAIKYTDDLAEQVDTDSTVVSPKIKLSLRQIAALPIQERHKLLVPVMAATAEDFLNDSELTEFSVFDGEDWEIGND